MTPQVFKVGMSQNRAARYPQWCSTMMKTGFDTEHDFVKSFGGIFLHASFLNQKKPMPAGLWNDKLWTSHLPTKRWPWDPLSLLHQPCYLWGTLQHRWGGAQIVGSIFVFFSRFVAFFFLPVSSFLRAFYLGSSHHPWRQFNGGLLQMQTSTTWGSVYQRRLPTPENRVHPCRVCLFQGGCTWNHPRYGICFSTIPSLKLTVRTWKWMVGRWHFLLGWPIFRCYVSFRECMELCFY